MAISERDALVARFDATRNDSRRLFDAVADTAYHDRPIPLRHPIVFYEGHFSAFNFITLVRRALGKRPLDPRLERLFERGIDPADEKAAGSAAPESWPERSEVLDFVARCDEEVRFALANDRLVQPGNPLLENGEAVWTILEHERMHQETLRYMLHALPLEKKQVRWSGARSASGGGRPGGGRVVIPSGVATLGAPREAIAFGWDNEFEETRVVVPRFEVDRFPVTNEEFSEFFEAGGYRQRDLWSDAGWNRIERERVTLPPFWEEHGGELFWRGMFERIPLPASWPVWVTHAEAEAYAKWRGRRLMTEAEFHRAAYGTPGGEERAQPWGDEPPDAGRGNFDFRWEDPLPVGSSPGGASAWGVEQLVGNGWEWTSSLFRPFPRFRAMASYPPYSTDFFDGEHYVLKGASPATSADLVRRSFRNWFRPTYRWVFAKFRCASSS